jgi:hypothetical protein
MDGWRIIKTALTLHQCILSYYITFMSFHVSFCTLHHVDELAVLFVCCIENQLE